MLPVTLIAALLFPASLLAADKPNILVIFTDDVGIWNINAYARGMMRTRNYKSLGRQPCWESWRKGHPH